jgi:phosphatidylglycerophosphate synthase
MAYGNTVVVTASVDGPRLGPGIGAVLQVGVVAMLAATVGLDAAGWLVGIGVAVGTWALLQGGLRREGRSLGPGDQITLARTVLVGGVAALVAAQLTGGRPTGVMVAMILPALLLDAVDGKVARRTGTVSAFGARFDMEVDAFLILVLSALLAGSIGPWVLAIGAMRYAFVLVGWRARWLTAPLPPRTSRKVVAAVQGVALLVAVAGVLPAGLTAAVLALALALLVWSFARDIHWLARSARGRAEAQEASALPV